jgi:predicted kinase
MKNLYIIRGVPGSGKSTLAKTLVGDKDFCHKEADMYFIDRDGNYNFDPTKLKEAHEWCREEIEFAMKYEHPTVVVSNTFTREWEMQPYIDLANKYEYRVFSLIVENRHENDSIHGVPPEAVENMKKRFEIRL